MTNFDQWQKATADLYKKQNLSNRHQMFSQFGIAPLSVEDTSREFIEYRTSGHVFQNVTPYVRDIMDESFLSTPGSAVFLDDEWPDTLDTKDTFIYLNASPIMTSLKKALLTEQRCQQLNLGIDPYSLGLWKSKLYKGDVNSETLNLVKNQGIHLFRLTGQPYAMAGASDIQQLAILLASAVQLVSDYEGQLDPSDIFKMLSFELALRPHVVGGVSSLRSLRILLSRLQEIYGTEAVEVPIYVTPSVRFLGSREPWNNILRMTAISATAKMSGANGFLSFPYDLFAKESFQGARTSRNISEVLELESFLGQVNDPWLGSYSATDLENQMLEKSWRFFQEIEKKDGLRSVLRSGWLLDQVEVDAELQKSLFDKGELILTGVNDYPLSQSLSKEYPLPEEEQCLSVEEWWVKQYSEADCETLCDVARFIPRTLATRFEKWQFRSDRLREKKGGEISVPVFIESGLREKKKHKELQQALSLVGLPIKLVESIEEFHSPVVAVVASDPDGDFTKKTLECFSKNKVPLKIWAGIKNVDGFDYSLNAQSDFNIIFEKIFLALEGH